MNRHVAWGLLLVCAWGCVTRDALRPDSGPAPPDWVAWRKKRHESIGGTNGWSTLIMLHWLQEGVSTMGSDPTNHAVLPAARAAGHAGTILRHGKSVRFLAAPGVEASLEGRSVQSVELRSDADAKPSRVYLGDLSFVIIERGERLGLRVFDPEAPARLAFKGLNCFPYDPQWRIQGRFEPFPFVRTLRVKDVIGGTQEYRSTGAIVFRHAGREHRLDIVAESGGKDYFVMIHDETAGKTTYGSGRFLYVPKPDEEGIVEIDFNRAYTPPCGFTPFATCPLPPPQNWLPFPIAAGELAPPGHD